jgi:NitT/TauT family transport system ATP-binding protein
MITVNNLCKPFGEKQVLSSLSLSFEEGKVSLISGASGIGKTTLLRILSGLETADTGEIIGLENKKISYLFQEDRLFPWLTALENVSAVSGEKDVKKKALAILSELGLKDSVDKFPHELSGGMSRRVAIARTLIFDGDVVILDEPFRGLDNETEKHTLEVIKKYCEGKTVIAVTHDVTQFEGYADAVISPFILPK